MNNATRGVVLAAVAVILGAIILWQGYDDPTSAAIDTSSDTVTDGSGTDDDADDTGGDEDQDDQSGTDDGATDDGSGEDAEGSPTADVVVPETPAGDTGDGSFKPPAEVRVMVANGTGTSGAAGSTRDSLVAAAGYIGLIANSTNQPDVTTSSVYYSEGYLQNAQGIATTIGLPASAVQPMPAAPPVVDLEDAHILVELGTDVVS